MAKEKENGEAKIPAIEIARMVLDPAPDKLPGMTRIPLDQVRPCSFAAIFANELLSLCKLSRKSQELYAANWKVWHSENTKIPGLGKRKPPLNGENGESGKFFPDGITQHPPSMNDPRLKIPKINESIILEWLNQYYMLRRSTTPDYTMGAFELAAREVEAKPIESESGWQEVIRQ